MKIEVTYLGLLAEITGCSREPIDVDGVTVQSLKSRLEEVHIGLKDSKFVVAQAQEIVADNTLLTGAEIALLPPFAGG